jgi:hypothetical protein
MTNQTAKDVLQDEICGMLQDMAAGVGADGSAGGQVLTMGYFKPEDVREACTELAEEFGAPLQSSWRHEAS